MFKVLGFSAAAPFLAELAECAPLAATDYYRHGTITTAVLALDEAMAKSVLARRRYRKIYGVGWRPLILDAIDAPKLAQGAERFARSLTATVSR